MQLRNGQPEVGAGKNCKKQEIDLAHSGAELHRLDRMCVVRCDYGLCSASLSCGAVLGTPEPGPADAGTPEQVVCSNSASKRCTIHVVAVVGANPQGHH